MLTFYRGYNCSTRMYFTECTSFSLPMLRPRNMVLFLDDEQLNGGVSSVLSPRAVGYKVNLSFKSGSNHCDDIIRIKGTEVLSIMLYKVALTFPTFESLGEILVCKPIEMKTRLH